ncbi:MAG TPA: sulfite exporter TauE/SafE family protein [Aliidongia sp.]|uniref:sulfite exporter TauE/SafE family protein n=1 Tax=Aliidongia sp. TaxID=1914230 RepID=UPI002DDCCA9F|nr:sulfite exporter TauE/SafE family protein [Aliidongia sp.]HEV2673989.1 sulfite exporter TauE/SafE family protein [Aliidongia sp.]
MDVYLPIAAVTQDVFVLLALGLCVGFLSGMFGVGGGFLLTPLLIFIGVPQPVAVASSANQLVGASLSGVLTHWRRGNVDFKMGAVLSTGGFVGSAAGVALFTLLRRLGQIDLVISLSYVLLLGTLGTLMMIESVGAIVRARQPNARRRRLHQHTWFHGLPFKVRFRRSKLYISALLPLGLGFGIGVLSAILGIGGGFLIVPAMIYVLGMPTSVVPGTSLFQTVFIAASVTVLQALTNQTVDGVLALIMLVGGVIGVQYGARYGAKLRGEYLRVLLALLILAVGAKLLVDLTVPPDSLFSVVVRE